MQAIPFILKFIIIIFSIVIHEVAHGYAALREGDKTAQYNGRLTLNPIPHMDLLGTVILPLLGFFLGGGFFGWAKPVPVNPENFTRDRKSMRWVAFAGILANLAIAICFGILFKLANVNNFLNEKTLSLVVMIISINLSLAVFNLIPVYPLDGSKILLAILPASMERNVENFLIKNQILLLVAVIFLFGVIIEPVIKLLFYLFTFGFL